MKKTIFLFLLPLLILSSELSLSDYTKDQTINYENEVNLFEWEQMYFFLNNKLYSKKYTDYRLEKTLKIINYEKLNRFLRVKSFFDSKLISYSSPSITKDGIILFQNKKINRVYEILSQGESPKEIFKCLCIAQNSLVYKYSIRSSSKVLNMNLFLNEIEYENNELLSFIDLESREFGFQGCCELANILCE